MRHEFINADVLDGLRSLPDTCVQCVVTSPPYWSLRDYQVEGQIGLEPTPEEHVEKMVEVFREVRRVLRDDGTVWLNYGDCYAGNSLHGDTVQGNPEFHRPCRELTKTPLKTIPPNLKPKDLVGMPWRIAFALQADGWYLRSDIVWSKPNPMPESVTDRPTRAHEYIFLLAKQPRYFYDCDAVREPHKEPERGNGHPESIGKSKGGSSLNSGFSQKEGGWADSWSGVRLYNPAGRNRRTVWEIATQPMHDAHFATFPEALVEPCIKAGTSGYGCCPVCGAPWVRSVKINVLEEKERKAHPSSMVRHGAPLGFGGGVPKSEHITTGWQPSCACDVEETVPCVVLDPFGGSGTVAKVARDLGRSSIYIELSPEYVQIAKKRLRVGEQLDTGVCEYVVREAIS